MGSYRLRLGLESLHNIVVGCKVVKIGISCRIIFECTKLNCKIGSQNCKILFKKI